MSRVKALVFNTDKPVKHIRLVIDGKEVAGDWFGGNESAIKLAIVQPSYGDSPEVRIYYDTGEEGSNKKGPFRQMMEQNVFEEEYFGPGTNVALNGWTEIYGYSQHYMGRTNALYDLRVEVSDK